MQQYNFTIFWEISRLFFWWFEIGFSHSVIKLLLYFTQCHPFTNVRFMRNLTLDFTQNVSFNSWRYCVSIIFLRLQPRTFYCIWRHMKPSRPDLMSSWAVLKYETRCKYRGCHTALPGRRIFQKSWLWHQADCQFKASASVVTLCFNQFMYKIEAEAFPDKW